MWLYLVGHLESIYKLDGKPVLRGIVDTIERRLVTPEQMRKWKVNEYKTSCARMDVFPLLV